jgi:hypothetical protein
MLRFATCHGRFKCTSDRGPCFWILWVQKRIPHPSDRNGAFNDGDTDPTTVAWQEEKFKRVSGGGIERGCIDFCLVPRSLLVWNVS